MYDAQLASADDATAGLCRGYLLIRVFIMRILHCTTLTLFQVMKHIFTGPLSALVNKPISGYKAPNCVVYRMERVTGRHVAYAAVMVHSDKIFAHFSTDLDLS
jgi:hypothetical protein